MCDGPPNIYTYLLQYIAKDRDQDCEAATTQHAEFEVAVLILVLGPLVTFRVSVSSISKATSHIHTKVQQYICNIPYSTFDMLYMYNIHNIYIYTLLRNVTTGLISPPLN